MRNVHRGEMVGFKSSIHVAPRCVGNLLIGKTEMVKQDDFSFWVWVINRQFDIGQYPIGMSVGYKHWPRNSCGGLSKDVTIDELDASFNRVNVESSPHIFQKGDCGKND